MTAQHAWFEKLSPQMQQHLKENSGKLSEAAAEAVARAGRKPGKSAQGPDPRDHLDHDEQVYIAAHRRASSGGGGI